MKKIDRLGVKPAAALLLLLMMMLGSCRGPEAKREAFRPHSLLYLLQADALGTREAAVAKIAASGRDLVVIDIGYGGGAAGRWSAAEIARIRAARPGRRVVAYLSVGEAEDYRDYWRKSWDADRDGRPDRGAPDFLASGNPDWPGNYKVKYWREEWQRLILAALAEIVDRGFDGVCLDLVDAFEYFEHDPASGRFHDHRINPVTGRSYRRDMIAWVTRIAGEARNRRPGFLVLPLNAAQLLESEEYAAAIDGIVCEDLFTLDRRAQSEEHTDYVTGFLGRISGDKPVMVIEYAQRPELRQLARERCAAFGYVLLLTDRGLKSPGVSP